MTTLNEEQEKVRTYDIDTPLIVIAPAGTGKTEMLCARVLYIVQEKHLDPESICCITFTKRAAEEFTHRIPSEYKIKSGTTHSLALNALKKHPDWESWETATDKQLDEIWNLVIGRHALLHPKFPYTLRKRDGLMRLLQRKKNLVWSWETLKEWIQKNRRCSKEHAEEVIKILKAFEKEKQDRKLFAYDDMLETAWLQWSKICFPCSYLFVDEYQDMTKLQCMFVFQVACVNRRILVVGDPNQSIYGFCHAGGTHVLEYIERTILSWGGTRLTLHRNYRSKPAILKAACSVLVDPPEIEACADIPDHVDLEEEIMLRKYNSGEEEHKGCIDFFRSFLPTEETPSSYTFTDMVALFRIHKDLQAFVESLKKENIPYVIREKAENKKTDLNAITCSTIHAAKGLEWPIVAILGCDYNASFDVDEERKVYHVALSRPKHYCAPSCKTNRPNILAETLPTFGTRKRKASRSPVRQRSLAPPPIQPPPEIDHFRRQTRIMYKREKD